MTALPITGIELVDRELKRHELFDSIEAAEILAARLLGVWFTLHSNGLNGDNAAPPSQAQRRAQRRG
jgi:hypothetical protein